MKNLSIIINILLAVAVGILYYLHFNLKNQCNQAPVAMPLPKAVKSGAGIVFVNADSLLNNYEYYKELKKQLEEKGKRSESEFNSKASALQQEVQAYQQKAPTMLPDQRAAAEEGLMKKQQTLMQRKEELGQQLADEEQKLVKQLYQTVNTYLKKSNPGGAYQFVFSKNGPILMANDSLDITKSLIEGLNKEYKDSKKK